MHAGMWDDIKDIIRNGGNVTHVLNVKVAGEADTDAGDQIRSAVFRAINGIPKTIDVNGLPVVITWTANARRSSARYYFADVAFVDRFVKRHTDLWAREIKSQLDTTFGNMYVNGTTDVEFIVTKPLTYTHVLVDDEDDRTLRRS